MQRQQYAVLQKRKTVTLFNGRLVTVYLGLCKKGLAMVGKSHDNEFILVEEPDLSEESRDLLGRYNIDPAPVADAAFQRPPDVYSNISREEIIHKILSIH